MTAETTHGQVLLMTRYPVKSMGGEPLSTVAVGAGGLDADREFAAYGGDGKLASGKHSRRFRRMDPVFDLVAAKRGEDTVVRLPDGTEVVVDRRDSDAALSGHFGEPVTVRRETDVMHQDQAHLSIVGTATLDELGRHDGDGRPLDPRHLRANIVVQTQEPFTEDGWVGHDVTLGTVQVHVLERIERCRMVGVAQVGLPARGGLLKTISEQHDLDAGIYASIVHAGTISLGDVVTVH